MPVPNTHNLNNEEERRRREREEEIERMLLEHEAADDDHIGVDDEIDRDHDVLEEHELGEPQDNNPFLMHNGDINLGQQHVSPPKFRLSYTFVSFGAALALLWYAMRTRQQWYLAIIFLGSSKYAYIILGNAVIAACISTFKFLTNQFLGGLRLIEHEGLGDFFRWNITETCMALTMFRKDLTVESGILFLLLILSKCVHWVVQMRESHLRMTQDALVVPNVETLNGSGGFFAGIPFISPQQMGLQALISLLLVTDVIGLVCCIQHVATHGASVMLLFGFECAIMLVSCMSLTLLWNLHVMDGLLHYWHEKYGCSHLIHAWKDRKATLIFALEVQAQGVKFVFYCTFFIIVMTYYGLPINLFREVYVSFQTLKVRMAAFANYRKLVHSMNRFPAPPEDHEDMSCIICRDDMTIHDSKQLPGCGHVFHGCCLREWLVQQQTCPTCRSNIAVASSREGRMNRLVQDIAPLDVADEVEQAPEPAVTPDTIAPPRNIAESNDNCDRDKPPIPESVALASNDSKAPKVNTQLNDSIGSLKLKLIKEEGIPQHPRQQLQQLQFQTRMSQSNSGPTSPSIFPAFYKVTAAPATPVYQFDENIPAASKRGTSFVRLISCGTAVLCLDMEVQTMKRSPEGTEDELCLMLQIAGGGWVLEEHLEFVASIPVGR